MGPRETLQTLHKFPSAHPKLEHISEAVRFYILHTIISFKCLAGTELGAGRNQKQKTVNGSMGLAWILSQKEVEQ